MMAAGVPLRKPVAGIAMGLISEGKKFSVLSDILGDEDHIGDMDFKVAGTQDGITALQMDIKVEGLTWDIMSKALEQAKAGRLHILKEMSKVIATANSDVSAHAPRYVQYKIPVSKIRDIIGPGGQTIKNITATAGVKIDVDDSGMINISAKSKTNAEKALAIIHELMKGVEVGHIYNGVVKKIMDFGMFVECLPGTEGLVPSAEINENTDTNYSEGQLVKVKAAGFDKRVAAFLAGGTLSVLSAQETPANADGAETPAVASGTTDASPASETDTPAVASLPLKQIPLLLRLRTARMPALHLFRALEIYLKKILKYVWTLVFKSYLQRTKFDNDNRSDRDRMGDDDDDDDDDDDKYAVEDRVEGMNFYTVQYRAYKMRADLLDIEVAAIAAYAPNAVYRIKADATTDYNAAGVNVSEEKFSGSAYLFGVMGTLYGLRYLQITLGVTYIDAVFEEKNSTGIF
ncbi:hypothetical protein CHS0354_006860 [Potamilus streckersoni]|uniref:S1 motif domain-containing protein n=1 Tax=Potamilus streckersoni TaxID=2493646 RepID=A0AAE0WC59_9BIVA|nr:hypothetical protein CHS0354_006860 [Potamilus streckersoni]